MSARFGMRRMSGAICVVATVALGVGIMQAPAMAVGRKPSVDANRPAPNLGPVVGASLAGPIPAQATPASSISAPTPAAIKLPAASLRTALDDVRGAAGRPSTAAIKSWHELGSTGVRVASAGDAATISLSVADAASMQRAGVSGVAFVLSRVQGSASQVRLAIPDQLLTGMYGADYASRVRWIEIPASGPADARSSHPLSSQHVAGDTIVMAPMTAQATMVAAAAAPGGSSGSYTASSLKASSAWQVSAQTGGFSWSYPMRVPPSAAGPTPQLGLAYSSQAVDGETGGTNNQPDEIGDGWMLGGTGFIERTFTSCGQVDNVTGGLVGSGDLCWTTDNATMSFGGHSGRLIKVNSTLWKLQGDDGSRIEHLSGTTAGCGGAVADCWRLTTLDGTQYYFGRNKLPGWVTGKAQTKSEWTASVCGSPTALCSGSTLATIGPFTTQAWRWNLDYVLDPHGNSEAMYYQTETNLYRRTNSTATSYIRGGYLDHIDYGMRAGSEYATNAASDKVLFGQDTYGRCDDFTSTRSTTCTKEYVVTNGVPAAEVKPANPAHYPDTPWDQFCSASPCTGLTAPTFWSGEMLNTITAQALIGTTVSGTTTYRYTTVDQWTLGHSFPANGETTLKNNPAEWLTSIAHSGTSSATSVPKVTFTGISMPNRVDGDGLAGLWKYRITSILNETGAKTTVYYSDFACDGNPDPTTCGANLRDAVIASAQTNQRLVYPQYWTPPQTTTGNPQEDIFNKYVVLRVDDDPRPFAPPAAPDPLDPVVTTQYVYYGTPAWRFDTSAQTLDEDRTWSDYAGYSAAEVRVGDPNQPALEQTTDYTFLQGMDGDLNGTAQTPDSSHRSVTLTASNGTKVTDSLWSAGRVLEQITRVGANGGAGVSSTPVLSDSINMPWESPWQTNAATASTSYTYSTTDPTTKVKYAASFTVAAHLSGSSGSTTIQTIAGNGKRTSTASTTFDPTYGLPVQSGSTSPDAGSTCTTTTYAVNATAYLVDYPSEVNTVGVACGSTPTYPGDAVTDTRSSYDNAAPGVAPTKGDLTKVEVVKDYTGSTASTAVWLTKQASTYDALGRPLNVTDAMKRTTVHAYTPAASGPLTQLVVTDPAPFNTWKTTTVSNPMWGFPTSVTDPNGKVTTYGYDGLGRLTGVWLPDRPYSTHTTSPSTGYAYVVSQTGPNSIATSPIGPNGTAVTTYALYDGLGRERQTQTPSEAVNTSTGAHILSGVVIADTGYDMAGRVVSATTPYANPQFNPSGSLLLANTTLPGEMDTTYDGAGRPTATIQMVDGSEAFRTSVSYKGVNEVDKTPPAGGTPTSTFTDSHGRTVKLTQYLSSDLTGTPETTAYSYDARGSMTAMTSPAGQTWTWTYDPLGRQHVVTDPAKHGNTTFTYNDDDSVKTEVSPEGTLQYTYDELGRIKTESDGSGTALATWAYDPTFGTTQVKGQLASTTRIVPGTTPRLSGSYITAVTGYDTNNRPTGSSVTLPSDVAASFGLPTPGVSYTNTVTYNADGSVATAKDPAAGGLATETVTSLYTNLGHVYAQGSGLSTYLGDAAWTHANALAQLDLTNGHTEVDRSYTYADGTNRLTDLLTTTSAATNIHPSDDAYAYDNDGELTSDTTTADTLPTDTQCFSYDHQQNLTEAWTPSDGTACSSGPSSALLGGPAPYWTSYSVDAASGNRKMVVQHATTTTGTDRKDTYNYPAPGTQFTNGQGGSTAVATIAHATAPAGTAAGGSGWTAAGTDGFGYNDAGSTSQLPGQSLAYDAEGRLQTTTLSTGPAAGSTQDNVYDTSGNLLYQHVTSSSSDPSTASTLYVGDTELRTVPGSSAVTGVRTYSANGVPIAERTSSATGVNTVNWLCAGANSTSGLEIDATTLAQARRYLDPFGNPRTSTPPTWSSNDGYLNQPQNAFTGTTSSQTTQLGARVYDGAIGRFLTVDPKLHTDDPQQDDGYSYAANDPTNRSDPSGLDGPIHCSTTAECNAIYGGPPSGCGSDASCEHDNPPPPPGSSSGPGFDPNCNPYCGRETQPSGSTGSTTPKPKPPDVFAKIPHFKTQQELADWISEQGTLIKLLLGPMSDSLDKLGERISEAGRLLSKGTPAERSAASHILNTIKGSDGLKVLSKIARSPYVKTINSVLVVASAAISYLDARDEGDSVPVATTKAVSEAAGGWAGAIEGSEELGAAGAALCEAPCALIGAALGAGIGSIFGELGVKEVENAIPNVGKNIYQSWLDLGRWI